MKKRLHRFVLLMAMTMLIVLGIPSTLSADAQIPRKEAGLQSYPVAASATIYKGAMVGSDGDGYLVPMSTTITFKFVGIAYEQIDNSSGSDGDKNCRVHTSGVFKLTATSIAQTMVGQPMFAIDDATMDDSGTSYQLIGVLVEYSSATSGWVDIGQRPGIRGVADNLQILTDTDTKNVRINSRNYTATSGDVTAVQSKPNVATGGTIGVTGIEVSPRFAEGAAGSKLVGVMSNPILKGSGDQGDLSSAMRCYEAKLESDSGSTRTVAEAYCLHCMQALHGTVTTGPYPIAVDAGGGNVAWAGFAKLPDDSQVANDEDTGDANTIAGYIKVLIGTNTRYIYTYSVLPSA